MEKSKIKLAPIVLFAYKRPEHTLACLQSLKQNKLAKESELYVYLDGPKKDATPEDLRSISEVKKTVLQELWCKKVHLQESKENKGLAKSVLDGVSEVLKIHEYAIVLEDDHVCDQYFLDFMNQALSLYSKNSEVACISGYIYPIKQQLPQSFFIKGADCWGWATWRRAWEELERDGEKLLYELEQKNLTIEFDFGGTYPYTQMLKDRNTGKNNSWAILWYASAFLKNKLCLYPGHSLIHNIGNDGSGTHAGETKKFEVKLKHQNIFLKAIKLEEDKLAKSKISAYFKSLQINQSTILKSIKKYFPDSLKSSLKKFLKFFKTKSIVYGWSGNYSNWEQVLKLSSGYDSELILNRVKEAVLKVKRGEAAFERDSVCFDQLEYSETLLKHFKQLAKEQNNQLRILDFGGSLGSLYFQYKRLLPSVKLDWKVVEQKHFVETGNKEIANKELSFYENMVIAEKNGHSDVLLLSSVLAYIPEPFILLNQLLQHPFKHILLYRIALVDQEKDRLTLQKVPPDYYEASYPAWFLSETKLLSQFQEKFTLIEEFKGDIETEIDLQGQRAYWKGFVFKRNT